MRKPSQHRGSEERIVAWVPAATRARFRALAVAHGVSESRLSAGLIEAYVQRSEPGLSAPVARGRVSERVTVRLRPGDDAEISRLATARGMRVSTYIAALVRAHVLADPVIPRKELAALERAVAELSAVGRNLNQIARALNVDQDPGPGVGRTLAAVVDAVENVRQEVRGYRAVVIASWEVTNG